MTYTTLIQLSTVRATFHRCMCFQGHLPHCFSCQEVFTCSSQCPSFTASWPCLWSVETEHPALPLLTAIQACTLSVRTGLLAGLSVPVTVGPVHRTPLSSHPYYHYVFSLPIGHQIALSSSLMVAELWSLLYSLLISMLLPQRQSLHPEIGGSKILRNVVIPPQHCKAS